MRGNDDTEMIGSVLILVKFVSHNKRSLRVVRDSRERLNEVLYVLYRHLCTASTEFNLDPKKLAANLKDLAAKMNYLPMNLLVEP